MNIRAVVTNAELAQAQREFGWTENRTRVTGVLYNSGLSASQVACLIGRVTRNAVIGIINRKGLADEARKVPAFSNASARGVREKPLKPARIVTVKSRAKPDDPPPPIIDAAIPLEQRRALLDLDDACCHWPVGHPGQPDFFYCGAAVRQQEGERHRPYCPAHTRRAHDTSWRRARGTENPRSQLSLAGGRP